MENIKNVTNGLQISSRRVISQSTTFPQRSVSVSEPFWQHPQVGKTDDTEDNPVHSHAISWHLCQKLNTGLRRREFHEQHQWSHKSNGQQSREKTPTGFAYMDINIRCWQKRKRGLISCRKVTDGYRYTQVSKVKEASYRVSDNLER